MMSYKLALLFTLCITLSYAKVDAGSDANSVNASEKSANSSAPAEKQPSSTSLQSSFLSSELTWKSGLGQALIVVGVTAMSFALIGAVALVISPLIGYRTCSIFGNCENTIPYSMGSNLQNTAQPNVYPADALGNTYFGYPSNNYKKRSIESFKPILETLAKTYENLS